MRCASDRSLNVTVITVMVEHFKRLVRYRGLLWNLAVSELKSKHRQTALGMLWALLQPVSLMVVYAVVFSVFVNVPIRQGVPYALFAYVGLVTWLFFATSFSTGTTSVVSQMNLITKASFPREVIPLSKLIASGFDFLIGWGCFLLLLAVYGMPFKPMWFLFPWILCVHVLFTAGLVLWGAALYVLKRDVGSVMPLLLQIWMFLSPVIYPSSLIPEKYQSLYLINPMATIIESYRSAALGVPAPSVAAMWTASVIAIVAFASGYAYFKHVEVRFADIM